LLLLYATSQPLLTQSAKLTLVSNHEQLLFFGDCRQKVILGGELLLKLSRTVHRRVDLSTQLRLNLSQCRNHIGETYLAHDASTGRFWTMDSYDGDPQSPMSLHKYIYAVGESVDRLDPSGHDSLDELMAAFTVASTVASLSNVLVAGVYSLYSGLPDAVGFGVYAAGGVGESHTLGGIAGAEVVYLPRLRQVAVYTWGGIEGEGTRDGSVRRLVLEF
jgi:hypothetical protein